MKKGFLNVTNVNSTIVMVGPPVSERAMSNLVISANWFSAYKNRNTVQNTLHTMHVYKSTLLTV